MKKGFIYILLSAILFSTMEIVIKVMSSDFDFHPIQLNLIRFFIGAIILAPLAIQHMRKSGFTFNKENIFFFIVTGFLCVVISMTFYQLAIVYTKASTVAILFSCNPLFVVPLAHFLLKEKLTKRTIWALIISLIGILSIVNPFEISNPTGIVYALLSAVSFALYSVVGKKGIQQYQCDGVILTCFSFVTGSIEILALTLISKISAVSNWLTNIGLDMFAHVPITQGISWSTLPSLIYIGIFVTGLGFAFYFLAMDETSASTASTVFFIKPALAPILAFFILNEAISPNTAAGIVFIMIGSCLILFADKKTPKLSANHPKVHSQIRSNG
jgi:drug/metabolite transporter (DMT)-like permease